MAKAVTQRKKSCVKKPKRGRKQKTGKKELRIGPIWEELKLGEPVHAD